MRLAIILVVANVTLKCQRLVIVAAELYNRVALAGPVAHYTATSFSQVARSMLFFGLGNDFQFDLVVCATTIKSSQRVAGQ